MERFAEVADGVLVFTSRNYMTTTTVIVGPGREAVLIDPAWQPDELAGIADVLAAQGLRVIAGPSTHFHHDHLLWHPAFGTPPRWASAATTRVATERRAALLAELGPAQRS